MKIFDKAVSSSKKKNFPKILLGSQKLRDKIKAKNVLKKKRKEILNRLTCEKCNETFATWWDVREHWQSSGHKEPEQCRWCRKRTFALQSHLCKEHWDMACMCKYCGQLFMFRERLEEHVHRHSSAEYRCYLCGKRRETEDLLRQHIYQHYVFERYGCNVCEKRFKKKKNVEKHLKNIHFICQYCGNTCENKEDLIKHYKTHNDLKCVFCKKVFSQKNRLKYHYQMQHGHQDFYKCSLCFLRFPLKSKLLEHFKLKHKGYAKIFCETCDMPFLYWSQYLNHFEKIHAAPQDKFFCSFCNFSTNLKSKLQWHIEKTSGDGFFCKVCQLHLECKTKFDDHMRMHEGKKVWDCDYCDRSYAAPDILKHHVSVSHQAVIIAENTRAHPCLVPGCNKYYVSKSSLARHMRRNHAVTGVSHSSGQFCAESTVICRLPLTQEKRSRQEICEKVISNSTQSFTNESSEPTDIPEKSTEKMVFGEENDINDTLSSVSLQSDKPVEEKGFEDEADINDNLSDMLSEKSGFEEEAYIRDNLPSVSGLKKRLQLMNESDTTEVDAYYCDICSKFWFTDVKQFSKHMSCHKKQVWEDECAECEEILESPEDAVRHYVEDHLKVQYVRYSSKCNKM